MKQVRFDTPRRSDSRLYSYEDRLNSPGCEEPRLQSGHIPQPTAVKVPEAINNLYSCSPVQQYEINPTPQPVACKTILPSNDNRLSAPCTELELSRLEGNDVFVNNTRRMSADDSRFQKGRTCDAPNELPKHLKQREYVDISNGVKSGLDLNQHGAKAFVQSPAPFSKPLHEVNKVLDKQFHAYPSHTRVDLPNFMMRAPYERSTCNCHDCTSRNNENCMHHHCYPPVNVQPVRNCCQSRQHDILEPSLCFNTNACNQHYCHPNDAKYKLAAKTSYGHKISSQSNEQEKTAIEKQMNVATDNRDPTVSDLFRIIQMQNEQLKMLQSQVDKLLATQTNNFNPIQNFVQERVSIESGDRHKISIGVMTSFEVVKSKERIKNNQILTRPSIENLNKVNSTDNMNVNFLEGISPIDQDSPVSDKGARSSDEVSASSEFQVQEMEPNEKTVNELSLCNLQLDNALTPQLSPDQSIYIDLKDYSGSDNDDHSAAGWTYYNKVMNHVNEMLQESEQRYSAEGLHRRAMEMADGLLDGHRPHSDGCANLHVDRTDLSITKRVTFKEHAHRPPTVNSDTSLQINRLAAKYLRHAPRATRDALDVSVATRRYMERHNIIKDTVPRSSALPSRILDITALKQQPKLL